ncbi:MAG: hypothetical protein JWP97_6220 [Labilithrix sp.]|nr:hypothetical protein [Labilithrix sp.]
MRSARDHGPRRLFFLLVLVPMFCVFPYLRGVNNPNEFVRVFTAISIVEQHTFSIDEPVALWGWTNDMAKVPSRVDGTPHYFMVKAPGVVYCGVPGYFLFSKVVAPLLGKHFPTATSSMEERLWWLRASTWALRLTTSALPCFLFLLWFEKYLRAFAKDPLVRYTAVAACGLGTNYLAYVHMFASHSQYASLAFLGFALTEQEHRRSRGDIRQMRHSRALLAGFCISACVAFEYQSLFLTVVLSLYAVWVFTSLRRPFSITRLLAFAAGGLVNIPPVMYFHWRAYNNPFTPGHQMLETAQFAAEHKRGLWGILWPTWEHVRALMIDPGFGFFGMSPFMWIGLLAVPLLIFSPKGPPSRRSGMRAATLTWWVACAALLGVNAGFIEWRAGWTVGPRYLVPCAPFFAFGAACGLDRVSRSSPTTRALVRGFAGGLCLASVLTIGLVGLVFDTLPENIQRPFAQFAVPMIETGHVPHHVGEWFGWTTTTGWYIACAALVLAPLVAALWPMGERASLYGARIAIFAAALALGMVPALFPAPSDGTPLFVLFHGVRGFLPVWEPPGRDRISLLREEAERYGPRRPCLWYQLGDLERVLGDEAQAIRFAERTTVPRPETCRHKW